MTPTEKAEHALNIRIARLQAALRETQSEETQGFLIQSVVICIGVGEALTDYVRGIGEFARARHSELKQAQATLTAQHDDLLRAGNELLARLKASPADRAIRREIETVQRNMAAIQKNLKRGANALQRETAPSLAMIDPLAVGIRRLCEADQLDALKRTIKLFAGHARDLYAAHPGLAPECVIDSAAWEKSAGAEIDRTTDFYAAYAHAGYQAMLALDAMRLAVSETPPGTGNEALQRASESVAARLKTITARFAAT